MTIIRVCLDGEDRKRYGGDEPLPENLTLDTEWLKDLPAGELDALEMTLDVAMAGLLTLIEPKLSTSLTRYRRAMAYLAVRQAGREVDYDQFQPRLLRATFTQEVGEAGPPAGPSGDSSEA